MGRDECAKDVADVVEVGGCEEGEALGEDSERNRCLIAASLSYMH